MASRAEYREVRKARPNEPRRVQGSTEGAACARLEESQPEMNATGG